MVAMQAEWDEHQALASRSRAALLEVLRQDGGAIGVDELAAAVHLHVNTTREHLDRLVAAGLVSRAAEHRTSRGRPRILYRHREPAGNQLRAAIDQVLLAGYGQRMSSPSDGAQAAGRHVVDTLVGDEPLHRAADPDEALAVLVSELDRLGFDPQLEGTSVHLRHCPVEGLARGRSEIVCAAHLGMTSEMVDRIGHLEIVESTPITDGSSCRLTLRPIA